MVFLNYFKESEMPSPSIRLAIAVVVCMVLTSPAFGQPTDQAANKGRQTAKAAMAKMQADRWELADREVLVAPWVPARGNERVELIVNSRITKALDLQVSAPGESGEIHLLAEETLAPRGTLRFNVGALMNGRTGIPRHSRSLRIEYFGDPEMVQAWLLVSGDRGTMELPLTKVSQQQRTEWQTFWNLDPLHSSKGLRPILAAHNLHAEPVTVSLRIVHPSGKSEWVKRGVDGNATFLYHPSARLSAAALTIAHDGSPGQIQVAGVLTGPRFLASLPLSTTTEETVTTRESMALSADTRRDRRQTLSLYNFGPSDGEALIEIVRARDGEILASQRLPLLFNEYAELDLPTLVATATSLADDDRYRLRITAPDGVSSKALESGPQGQPRDIELISDVKVHDGGTYPLPSLEDHKVVTEFLNLGDEPAQIFGHLSWSNHEFALEPFEVPAGGLIQIDFRELRDQRKRDPAGRIFEPGDEPAYFQWLGRRGSSSLIARTTVQPVDSEDSYGFNCFGCCEEFPWGRMEPQFATFLVGTSADFMAAEFIDTCAGTMGPYYAAPQTVSYNSPLSWSTESVSASAETEQNVTWTSSGLYLQSFCKAKEINFGGEGPTVGDLACQATRNPGFDPKKGCCGHFPNNALACNDCCNKEESVAKCRCDKLWFFKSLCKTWASLASNTCRNACNVGCGNA